MDKYLIEGDTLRGLADALRNVSGTDRTYTPSEMIEAVTTILDSATFILVDENGNEVPAVFVEHETVFDAEANDIRLGKTAVNQNGVVEGTKEIPAYHTREGARVITPGSDFIIPTVTHYDYTKLQAIIGPFNTSLDDSVCAERVVINSNVYEVLSTVSISEVLKDGDNSRIHLNITNESDKSYLLQFFMYKEIY